MARASALFLRARSSWQLPCRVPSGLPIINNLRRFNLAWLKLSNIMKYSGSPNETIMAPLSKIIKVRKEIPGSKGSWICTIERHLQSASLHSPKSVLQNTGTVSNAHISFLPPQECLLSQAIKAKSLPLPWSSCAQYDSVLCPASVGFCIRPSFR